MHGSTPYHEGGGGGGGHFHPFLACNSPLVSHQHTDELGLDHHSGRDWTWTHQQISHETSADGSSSAACMPIRGVGGDDHESVCGILLDALGDTHLLPNVFGPCGQKHNVQSYQLYPDSRRWDKPVSPHGSDKDNVFSLCVHPQPMPM